jgi:hypothetical protein
MVRGKKKNKKSRIYYSNILPINPKGKEMNLEDREYIKEYILKMLKNGWIVLMGDVETIEVIENVVNLYDTDTNGDFTLIMGNADNIYLTKKTDLLKYKIIEWSDIDDEIYNKLLMIDFVPSGEGVMWDYEMRKECDSEEELNTFYNDYVENIIMNVLGMKEDEKV